MSSYSGMRSPQPASASLRSTGDTGQFKCMAHGRAPRQTFPNVWKLQCVPSVPTTHVSNASTCLVQHGDASALELLARGHTQRQAPRRRAARLVVVAVVSSGGTAAGRQRPRRRRPPAPPGSCARAAPRPPGGPAPRPRARARPGRCPAQPASPAPASQHQACVPVTAHAPGSESRVRSCAHMYYASAAPHHTVLQQNVTTAS